MFYIIPLSFRLVKIQRRFCVAVSVLSYFGFNRWTFVHDKFLSINKKLLPADLDDFYFIVHDWDIFLYIENGVRTIREVVFHEDPKMMNLCRRKAVR